MELRIRNLPPAPTMLRMMTVERGRPGLEFEVEAVLVVDSAWMAEFVGLELGLLSDRASIVVGEAVGVDLDVEKLEAGMVVVGGVDTKGVEVACELEVDEVDKLVMVPETEDNNAGDAALIVDNAC